MNGPDHFPLADRVALPDAFAALRLEPVFTRLPEAFYTRLEPQPLPAPYLVDASDAAASSIGLSPEVFAHPEFAEAFAGNLVLPGSAPFAAVYSGHQFGAWAGQLGDGRAHGLGSVRTADGPIELQLKGSGRTPYSRMGDGRAVLRSSIREFLCSEAMAGLGIPTTRALCVVGSDQPVLREGVETAAVVTRMAPSFVRFGSFEHWAARDRQTELRRLADHVIDTFMPELRDRTTPYEALLREVSVRTARLIAQWQAVGFMHGVMNTDNMSILGLTLDYGPFGFMEAFDAGHICNHSDQSGRYAYARQPDVAYWNLYALGQALLPLIADPAAVRAAIDETFPATFERAYLDTLRAKLGWQTAHPDDEALIGDLFALLQAQRPDYTLFFRGLCDLPAQAGVDSEARADAPVRDLFIDRAACDAWLARWRARLQTEPQDDAERRARMRRVNPRYVLRNWMAESAIRRAREHDFSEVADLRRCLQSPYDDQPEFVHYAQLPPDWANGLEVSCSS